MVTAFPAGSVAAAAPVLAARRTVARYLVGNPAVAVPGVLLGLGGPVLLLVPGLRRKRAQEAPGLPHRQRFQPRPPPGVRPLLATTLLTGTAKPVDAVAVLLDLSARGFVSVTPVSKSDWRLVAVRPPDAAAPPEVHEVHAAVFRDGPDTTLTAAARGLRRILPRLRQLARDGVVAQGWFHRRPSTAGGLVALGVVMVLAAVPLIFALAFLAHPAIVGPALLLGGILVVVHAGVRAQPRTEAGEVARSQLMAFRRTLAGIDPAQVPPEQREAALGDLRPYAVVLGLAPQLASAFLAAGVVAGGHAFAADPMWWSTFAGDATRATAPSSSSSGGSGFSGGSAGGGGGGGGGGSW